MQVKKRPLLTKLTFSCDKVSGFVTKFFLAGGAPSSSGDPSLLGSLVLEGEGVAEVSSLLLPFSPSPPPSPPFFSSALFCPSDFFHFLPPSRQPKNLFRTWPPPPQAAGSKQVRTALWQTSRQNSVTSFILLGISSLPTTFTNFLINMYHTIIPSRTTTTTTFTTITTTTNTTTTTTTTITTTTTTTTATTKTKTKTQTKTKTTPLISPHYSLRPKVRLGTSPTSSFLKTAPDL